MDHEPGSKDSTIIDADKRRLRSAGLLVKKGLLVILSENFFGKTWIIDRPEVVIGRQRECDFSIDDPLISRQHCRIAVDEQGNFQLHDLSSKNSTHLNKRVVEKSAPLFYGDRILIGSTILRFYLEEKVEKK